MTNEDLSRWNKIRSFPLRYGPVFAASGLADASSPDPLMDVALIVLDTKRIPPGAKLENVSSLPSVAQHLPACVLIQTGPEPLGRRCSLQQPNSLYPGLATRDS